MEDVEDRALTVQAVAPPAATISDQASFGVLNAVDLCAIISVMP